MFVTVAVICTTLIALATAYIRYSHQYWTRKNVFQLEPTFLFGNRPPKGVHPSVFIGDCYKTFKKMGLKYGGFYFFTTPSLIPVDLELIKHILTKDFQHFQTRGYAPKDHDVTLEANIFQLSGSRWKTLRAKLTPTFTSGKLKTMFPTLTDCLGPMKRHIEKISQNGDPINARDIIACYTTDVIGSCAFGLSCNSFDEKEESLFRIYGPKLFDPNFRARVTLFLKFYHPEIADFLKLSIIPKDVEQFYMKVLTKTVEMRKKNAIRRNDFLQLLIDLLDDGQLQKYEVAAQTALFFLAGFETSTTSIVYCLYLIAKHQGVQEKVYDEITTAVEKHNGQLTYDSINTMKYLDQVLSEALRMFPPGGIIPRRCTQDYKIPNEDVIIEKGTMIWIPIYGIHHDEDYYPDSEKFDPERFSEENKNKQPQYAYLPFGEGPRICIAMRFALVESKFTVAGLLQNYKLSVNSKTIEPISIRIPSLISIPKHDIWLNIEKR